MVYSSDMASLTVRISQEAHRILRKLAGLERRPMQEVLDAAIEQYRRNAFLERANAAYEELQADPKARQEEQEERDVWNGTVADGRPE